MTAAAAARDPSLLTVIADSPWADECLQLDHMASLPLGPLAIPAIPAMPYEPALVDARAGARLEDVNPAQAAASPRRRVRSWPDTAGSAPVERVAATYSRTPIARKARKVGVSPIASCHPTFMGDREWG